MAHRGALESQSNKSTNVNASCDETKESADDWSQNPDWLPMCRGYADGTEPDEIIDVKDVDRGIARLLLPNWSLRTGEYCFCKGFLDRMFYRWLVLYLTVYLLS